MTSLAQLQSFVINLDRSTERLAAMQQRLARAGLPWQRVPAVDGRGLDLARSTAVDVAGYRRWHGKDLNPGEVGCYLSHIEAMRRFLAGPWAYALVLEDDADFPPDFQLIVEKLVAQAATWDIVKLSSFHSGTPVRIAALHGPYALAVPLSRHCNSNSILLNRRAARVLLEQLLPMRLPYDHALERAWLYGLRLRIVTPSPCPSDSGLSTTIGSPQQVRRLKLPLHQRLPAMLFRLRTELCRLGYGLLHVIHSRRG